MKVLFLTNIPSPYRVDFFNELGKICELTVLYELQYAKDRDKKWQQNKAENFSGIFLKGIRINNDSALCFSVIKFINNKSYDIIVIGGYSTPTGMLAIQYMKLRKIPFILNVDGGMIREDLKIKYIFKKYFIGSASTWLSTGNSTTKYLLKYGAEKEKIYKYPFTSIKENDVVKNALSYEEKVKLKNDLNIKGKKVILTVGQFIYRKGFDILIKAMKEVSTEYSLYIVGGEPTEEYLNLKNKLNLDNIFFVGFADKEIIKKYYLASDLFVLPTREDIWGLVINEAMAYGLPVITTNKCVAGMELIEDYINGFIVQVGDSNMLKEKINVTLKDDSLREFMALNNLYKINEYTIEKSAKVHLEIFNDCLLKYI